VALIYAESGRRLTQRNETLRQQECGECARSRSQSRAMASSLSRRTGAREDKIGRRWSTR